MSTARFFTKVNVRAAFYKIRIADREEHKTAFQTRFGLFK